MAAPPRSWIDSPSAGVSSIRSSPAMPSPFRLRLSIAHTRCYRRRTGRNDAPSAPTPDPAHRAGCSTGAVTVGLLAEFLLPGVTPTRLPLLRFEDIVGSIEGLVCP